MKKFLSIIMCVVLIASCFMLGACDEEKVAEDIKKILDETDENGNLKTLGGKTPKELYDEASAILSNATNFTQEAVQDISMVINGESMALKQNVLSKVDGDNSYIKSSGVEGSEMEGFYVDGVVYAKMNGVKNKASLSKAEYYEKFLGTTEEESKILDIPESWFKDIVIKKDGDEYYIHFVVSGEEYSKLIGKAAAGIDVSLATDVNYKVYLTKEGKLSKVIVEVEMEIEGAKVKLYSESKFYDVVTTAPITAPADADSYTDVTGSI